MAITCLALAGCAPPFLSVSDAVSVDGGSTVLAAHVDRPQLFGLRSEVERVPVTFRIGGQDVGRADTGQGGRAVVKCALPAEPASTFEVRAQVGDRELQATGSLFAWRSDRPIIAVDIDHTVSRTDYDDLILDPVDEGSRPIRGSREALSDLSQDYHIAYVTARARFLMEKTRGWLQAQGFPAGPLFTSPDLRSMIRRDVAKRTLLVELRRRAPNLLIGIGNSAYDADAYGASQMLAIVVNPKPKETYGLHAVVFRDWDAVLKFFAANRETLSNPDRLRRVIRGELPVQRIVPAWEDARPK